MTLERASTVGTLGSFISDPNDGNTADLLVTTSTANRWVKATTSFINAALQNNAETSEQDK